MKCNECLAFGKVCPHKPDRKDYDNDDSFLIDLETGVYDCHKTVQVLSQKMAELEREVEEKRASYDELREHGAFIRMTSRILGDMAKERGME